MQHTISHPATSSETTKLRDRFAAFAAKIGRALRGPETDLRDVRLTDQLERELADVEFRGWARRHWR